MKKAKALRIKQMINENFKHLRKLPKINTYATEIVADGIATVYITKTIGNGDIVPEGIQCRKITSYKQAICETKKLVDEIISTHKHVRLRTYPQFRYFNEFFYIRCRLAY